jgi:hypothetical protein
MSGVPFLSSVGSTLSGVPNFLAIFSFKSLLSYLTISIWHRLSSAYLAICLRCFEELFSSFFDLLISFSNYLTSIDFKISSFGSS